ncbi:MAG: S41 family peptidase [Pseudarcicella sp.]|nr:S41 family peptidase [Pseudarcicella sp.]
MKQHHFLNRGLKFVKKSAMLLMVLISGVFIGTNFIGKHQRMNNLVTSITKYREVLSLIETSYVDTVAVDSLVDYSIKKMLEKLDPHSVYRNTIDAQTARSQLIGSFDGIGIEYNHYQDTIRVINVFHKGPSDLAGLQVGDKIIKVDGYQVSNARLTNNQIQSKIRGSRGSEVVLELLRGDSNQPYFISVIRDKILSFSVSAGYMIDYQVGYIKIDRFSETTYDDFCKTLKSLCDEGMKRLVLDLRGNPGGYKDKAEKVVDELLSGEKLIVFTEGRGTLNDSKTFCKRTGLFEKNAVIVLMDEGSASASEIVAGALQDNDRALIVGRRSFGKGLVQMPVNLSDGSELRLTISRYYTPSGRSIQKAYTVGENFGDYDNDYIKRYKGGEFFIQDSIKFNQKLKYKTIGGRVVYGGGGISPDIFVPKDTSMYTTFYRKLLVSGLIYSFCYNYSRLNESSLGRYSFKEYLKKFTCSDVLLGQFLDYAKHSQISFSQRDFDLSRPLIANNIKALIAKNIFKKKLQPGFNNEYLQIMNQSDLTFLKALENFDKADQLAKGDFIKAVSEREKKD